MDVPRTVMKHKYTVEITWALFSEESYLVYEKYQTSIHKKDKEETRDGYTRFLCQVPLFDPEDAKVPEGQDPEIYLQE